MSEVSISGSGVTVTVTMPGDALPAAVAAFERARGGAGGTPETITHTTPTLKGSVSSEQSVAARIRRVAATVLADGRFHERREIAAAVRAAGLTKGNLDRALRHGGRFVRAHNAEMRPIYRDTTVPSPQPPALSEGDKPAWMRNPVPAGGDVSVEVLRPPAGNGHGVATT